MFGFSLSDTRTRTSHLNSSQPHSIYSAADSDPEPVTTLSGTRPGHALLDERTASPTSDPPTSPKGSIRRYSLRTTRFLTEKGSALKEAISLSKEKSKNRRTPSKKSSAGSLTSNAASFKSTTTRDASGPEEHRPEGHRPEGHQPEGHRPGNGTDSVHRPEDPSQRGNTPDLNLQEPSFNGQTQRIKYMEFLAFMAKLGIWAELKDRGVEHLNHGMQFVRQADALGIPLNCPSIFGIFRSIINASPVTSPTSQTPTLNTCLKSPVKTSSECLSSSLPTSPSQDRLEVHRLPNKQPAKALVKRRKVRHREPRKARKGKARKPHKPKRAPFRIIHGKKVPTIAISLRGKRTPYNLRGTRLSIGSVALGNGHHLDYPRTTNRPGKLFKPDTDTNTETETETNHDPDPDTEPEPEPNHPNCVVKPIAVSSDLTQILNTNPTGQPSNSPSPLPSTHWPINFQSPSILDLPFGGDPHNLLQTTQQSTQPQTNPSRQWESTSSISLGQAQADPEPSTLRPPPRVSTRSFSKSEAGPSRPRGTARQESSRARRASKPATQSQKPSPRLTPAATEALKRASTRLRLRHRLERKRRASGNTPPHHDHEGTAFPVPPELLEDDEEERVAAAAEANNCDPKPKNKPKPAARDIHGSERFILTVAKPHLFMHSVIEGAWQTRGLVTAWAHEIFQLSWEQEYPDLPVEPPSSRTIQCMVNSQPTFRGKSKDALRPFTEFYWGFKKPASTPEAIAHNIALAQKLLPNNFHCLSYDPPYGHYESEALKLGIAIVLFANPTAPGVIFPHLVNPCPDTAVAYVLANMQFTIEEFSTGSFQARDLKASDMLNKYVAHLRGLRTARRTAKTRFKRLAKEWFKFGFEYSGAVKPADPFTQPVTLASDIRPDTPTFEPSEDDYLPDPEPEAHSEPDEAGRYRKRLKGKGRA
ncbi:Formin-like protein 20 [Ceratobasidium sp. AG-Ba]|nr:Formin-like protein 20 [Ceratobasidium sp. AG-Ba]